MSSRVGIVGGGMLGLGLALKLRQQGHEVTVFEGAPQVGGLASAHELGNVTWDRFYHVTLLSDSYLRGLLDELGLGQSVQWRTTRTGFYTDGRLYSMSTSIDFLKFPPLSLIDKARLAGTILHASRIADGEPLEEIPVTRWLEKWSGRRTMDRVWLPLLRAKLGDNYRHASASFIWAIIARMYAARRSGLKKEMFGYVEGGYAAVLARLRAHLTSLGISIFTSSPVASVGNGSISLENGDHREFDAVVLTVPCPRVAALCADLKAAEKDRLNNVTYQGIICPSLLIERPLADYYVTNITDGWVPFTAVIEMTALVDRSTFGGRSLVYLPRYLAQGASDWGRSDKDILDESIATLERMYPHFRRSQVIATQVARVREVLAVSTLNYSRTLLPPLRTSLDRVFVVNSAQIANGTLNVNETLALAYRQAAALGSTLGTVSPVPAAA